MRREALALTITLILTAVAPAALAKKNPVTPAQPAASSNSQAGGLPATNARVTALEQAVRTLRSDLQAEIAARQAADAALAAELAKTPSVFVGEGSVTNLRSATATVASKTLPAGKYVIFAALQLVNGQSTGDANARCILRADGDLLADTTDLQFPILTTSGAPNSNAFGSAVFVPLQGAYSSASPVTIHVDCTESKGGNGGLDAFVQIAAIKAGSIQ